MFSKVERPSSKAIVSTIMSTIITVAAVIEASEVQGVDLPPWVFVLGGMMAPLVVYIKRENEPSSSAVEAAAHKL